VNPFVNRVYVGCYQRLVGRLFAVCGDLAEAEDLVQEGVRPSGPASPPLRSDRQSEAWLRTVAVNLSRIGFADSPPRPGRRGPARTRRHPTPARRHHRSRPAARTTPPNRGSNGNGGRGGTGIGTTDDGTRLSPAEVARYACESDPVLALLAHGVPTWISRRDRRLDRRHGVRRPPRLPATTLDRPRPNTAAQHHPPAAADLRSASQPVGSPSSRTALSQHTARNQSEPSPSRSSTPSWCAYGWGMFG